MSRIGQQPVTIPPGVKVKISAGNEVHASGPNGTLVKKFRPEMSIRQSKDQITVKRPNDDREYRSLHGTTRSIIANMVQGVTEGYQKELEVIGVGYRADAKKLAGMDVLEIALGFSHPIYFVPPEGIAFEAETVRGQNPRIKISGIDKQLVGQVAAKIRALRPPEPYKGKGVRYVDEFVRRKAGKTAAR